ncbi:MAG: RsbRD N-terminal domain-containing protein [Desulfobulbus sp.]
MELKEALAGKKKDILALWIERTLDSYTSPGFFKKATDPFANPVGSNISAGLTRLFEALLEGNGAESYTKPLDQVVRIRAVQEFTPGQAVAPFLELKWVIRQIFSADKGTQPLLGSLDHLDCEIDRIALAAFDIYSECREQLYRNRVQELKSGRSILTDAACPSALLKQEQKRAELRTGN